MNKERCFYDYAEKCDCSDDDNCGCSYPNNMKYSIKCETEKPTLEDFKKMPHEIGLKKSAKMETPDMHWPEEPQVYDAD